MKRTAQQLAAEYLKLVYQAQKRSFKALLEVLAAHTSKHWRLMEREGKHIIINK